MPITRQASLRNRAAAVNEPQAKATTARPGGMVSRDEVAGNHVLSPVKHAYPRLRRVKVCHPAGWHGEMGNRFETGTTGVAMVLP